MVFLLLYVTKSISQGEYKFGYLFKPEMMESGTFYLLKEKKSMKDSVMGVFTLSDNKVYQIKKKLEIKKTIGIKKQLYTARGWGKGIISKKSEDSIFIRFWKIKDNSINTNINADTTFINNSNTGDKKKYVFVIDTTKYTARSFDIPFRFWQFMATSIPFRAFSETGKLEGDFLNANATFVKVSGHTRFYRSTFVKPRNRYFAYGPFLGLSTIENPITKEDEFGINYGVNCIFAVHGLNIIVAYGFENGFKTETNDINGYLGFGIGFKLFETFNPEIKTGEED